MSRLQWHGEGMRKVALVGFAQKTIRTDWPDDIEVWTINCAWNYGFTRIDRLFEMHPISQLTADLDRPTKWEGQHWLWLQEPHDFPIYMMQAEARFPASVTYPLAEICDDLFANLRRGERMNRYLTSSASFLAAMAIYERYDVIYIAGFEMASGTEFGYQRDGLAYLIGLANGRGIEVVLPENTGLMKAKLYAYEAGQYVSREVIQQHLENYQAQLASLAMLDHKDARIYRANGAVVALTALLENSALPIFGRQALEHILQKYGAQHSEAMGYYNKFEDKATWGPILMQAEGALQAYENLIDVCDLQEPNLALHEIAHFVELKKIDTTL